MCAIENQDISTNKVTFPICKPSCIFFPDMSCKEGEWKYDENNPNIKKRIRKKQFNCCYDGHKIDWYKCPLLLITNDNSKEENIDDD